MELPPPKTSTKLKIRIVLDAKLIYPSQPPADALTAVSTLSLENGIFSLDGGLELKSEGNVGISFSSTPVAPALPSPSQAQPAGPVSAPGLPSASQGPILNTLALTSKASLIQTRSGQYVVSFGSNQIELSGLKVELAAGSQPPLALVGTMSHTLNTGSFFVASTGNPQGDTLKKNVESRAMALVP